MNRAAIRNRVRRRIQEIDPDYFTDAEIDKLINEALSTTQVDILGIVPDAFLSTYLADVLMGIEAYSWPSGMLFEVLFEIKLTSSGSYSKMRRRPFDVVRGYNLNDQQLSSETDEILYAHRGRDFIVSPVPLITVVDGFRLTHVQVLTLSSDTDVPALPIPLHKAVAAKAEALCLTEMGESSDAAEGEYQITIGRAPSYLRKTGGDSDLMIPDTRHIP